VVDFEIEAVTERSTVGWLLEPSSLLASQLDFAATQAAVG
jgi:hypothetical protein